MIFVSKTGRRKGYPVLHNYVEVEWIAVIFHKRNMGNMAFVHVLEKLINYFLLGGKCKQRFGMLNDSNAVGKMFRIIDKRKR